MADPAVFVVEAGKDNKVAGVEVCRKGVEAAASLHKAANHRPLAVFVVEQHKAALEQWVHSTLSQNRSNNRAQQCRT